MHVCYRVHRGASSDHVSALGESHAGQSAAQSADAQRPRAGMALSVQDKGRELLRAFGAQRRFRPGHHDRAQDGRCGARLRPRHRGPRSLGKRSSLYRHVFVGIKRALFVVKYVLFHTFTSKRQFKTGRAYGVLKIKTLSNTICLKYVLIRDFYALQFESVAHTGISFEGEGCSNNDSLRSVIFHNLMQTYGKKLNSTFLRR